jgi:hypothetical protein
VLGRARGVDGDVAATVVITGMIVYGAVVVGLVVTGAGVEEGAFVAGGCALTDVELTIGATVVDDDSRTKL